MYGYGYSLYNQVPFGRGGIDPSAAAYFAATGITGATQQTAIDNLVKGLKADGLWSKMKAVYPFVTDNRNLLGYTEQFDNAYWSKANSTITANATTAPDGTTTADKLITLSGVTQGRFAISQSLLNTVYSVSIYAKQSQNLSLRIGVDGGYGCYYNLSTGTLGTQTNATGTITNVGNGWYRCTFTFTLATAGSPFINYIIVNNDESLYTGNGTSGIFTWGAQLELGSTATTYQPIATTQQAFISSQFKYNLVNPVDSDAAFRLVFNGGWTHSSNGATPNGTNGYADTYLNSSTNFNSTNYNHLSFYSRTPEASSGFDYNIGSYESGSGLNGLVLRRSNNASFFVADYLTATYRNSGDPSIPTGTVTDGSGFFVGSQTGSNIKLWRSSLLVSENSQISTGLNPPNATMYIGSANGIGGAIYANRQAAFASIGEGLTDTEAANLYTRVQTFNQAISRQVGVPIVSDADAQAFLNSAEITDITQANAINTLVTDLKAQGLWTKMKAIYPFVGGTASTHKYNLKDPRDLDAAYRLVFNGGWTHSSTGATPNGTNGYADTFLTPSFVFSTSTLAHLSYYSKTNSAVNFEYVMGSANTGTGALGIIARRDTNNRLYVADFPSGTSFRAASDNNSTNGSGYFVGTQQGANIKLFVNNALAVSNTTATSSSAITSLPIIIGGFDFAGSKQFFTNKQTAFASIGDGLTDTEATELYNAVNTYQVALSRNV